MLFCFPRDALDEIWDLNESVSAGFLAYFWLEVYRVGKKSLKN